MRGSYPYRVPNGPKSGMNASDLTGNQPAYILVGMRPTRMQTTKVHVAGVLFALWSVASLCGANSWPQLEWETFYSGNGRFAVTIVREQPEGAAEWGPNNWPPVAFYSVDPNGQLNLVRELKLVNEVAPVAALVSDDGQYLATFNNRHSLGSGDDAIVIYRTDGELIRSLSLEDILTAKDIEVLRRSVSSRHGRAEEHFIDEDLQRLVLRIARCTEVDLCLEKPAEVAINLAYGTLVHPVRDLLPRREPTVSLRPGIRPGGQDSMAEADLPCVSRDSFSRAPVVPFDSLQATAAVLPLPSFTELAIRARVTGTVILELLVDKGAVTCVKSLKGLPMGLSRLAQEAALQWRFSPSPDRKGPVRSVVAFGYSFVEVWPDPEE
jgi:hypothetical protein